MAAVFLSEVSGVFDSFFLLVGGHTLSSLNSFCKLCMSSILTEVAVLLLQSTKGTSNRRLSYAHRIMGSPKGKHCKSLQRNVWRGAVSLFKSSVFGQRMPHFAVIL